MNASLPATARDQSALQAELTAALSQIVSDDALLWEREDTTPYECDGLAAYRQVPLAVVLPDTEAQVVEILRVCHRMGVPVVPRGAGTSLSGGAMPTPGGLVLSLAKFKRIIKVDPYTRTAVVQPGVRNLAISEAANPHALYYAPDPSSQIACTIGGNVNENSGGVHCRKYGLTVHNVLRVRAVMMDGEVVEFGSEAPDAPGLDLLATVIGSEGMLAVVTEVTVRLIPKPQLAQVIMASFDNVESGGNAVADVIAAGIIPAGLEMMDKPATAAVEEFVCAGYDLDAAAILLCESDGTPEEVAEEIARMSEVLRASGATRIQVSQSEAERLKFWSGARMPSRQQAASRPTITAWTAPSRASTSARCCGASSRWSRSTPCVASTCSTQATATCTRSSSSTAKTRTNGTAPNCSAPTSSRPASNSVAP